jgi:light-regulated signal transduction histidine kinase (bacteriophytochrome)
MNAAPAMPSKKTSPDPRDAEIAALKAQMDRERAEMRAFSYSISHDLRAPLRAIEGFSRIIFEDYADKLDDEGKRFLDHIVHNTQVMGSLIDDLLIFNRLTEKAVNRSAVDMKQLIGDVVATAKKPNDNAVIKVGELATLNGDPALLRAACEHLLANALKFSKRESAPAIEIGAEQSDGQNILWIKDNGVGFDMQYADKLFKVFQKLQKEPDFEGNGIGLAVVQRVADKHGGRVWAQAAPNLGATFFIAFPQ